MAVCILLEDLAARGAEVSEWLQTERGVKTVKRVQRSAFAERYPWLMGKSFGPCYPSEVLAQTLYLGPAASSKPDVLMALGVSHVVSVVERRVERRAMLAPIPALIRFFEMEGRTGASHISTAPSPMPLMPILPP